ncbi:hypothetical protein [Streptomyces fuscichromogenes]|uniref:DUF4034 domain-containing protein n=1 Tax=Streptomyces fuscichromogenes TaxID=1324013 RepID=A0A917UF11_9ACTN|nr:hypothetical protein [Streptomyces fuscichromogenes]GGM87963.1 hypothetical protein GCM10011578_004040 [Streptomyces fuscichromogenes]
MVDTMASLRALFRSPRRATTASPLAAGPLPADDEVLLDAPDERLAPALVAAGRGEYEPAAGLLAGTREAAEWEERDRYVHRLALFARSRAEWLDLWAVAAPHDPDLLLVQSQLAVDHAWDSPARAELLRPLSPLITAAARGDDRDPVPWRIALDHARGTNAGHKYFEELWEAAVRRAPHHSGCHVAALRYLATYWHGSHRECFDFADLAAQDAPPDSLVQALPARAAFGYLTDGCGPEVPRARLDAAADRAIALSARFPAADPWPAEVRNQLMYLLVRLERREAARAQLHLIGPYVTSFPWDRLSDDPLGHFLGLRDHLLAGTEPPPEAGPVPSPRAPVRPRAEHGGHATADDH